jgi:hypothetical protein
LENSPPALNRTRPATDYRDVDDDRISPLYALFGSLVALSVATPFILAAGVSGIAGIALVLVTLAVLLFAARTA